MRDEIIEAMAQAIGATNPAINALDALQSALKERGLKIVAREPTQEMLKVFFVEGYPDNDMAVVESMVATRRFKAMFDAAPDLLKETGHEKS